MRWEWTPLRFPSLGKLPSSSSSTDSNKSNRSCQNITMNMSIADLTVDSVMNKNSSIVAPPLYEAALIGNWNELLIRISSHPSEALYQDKCKNMALHLACRRQPPVHVVSALIRASEDSISRKTADGLTPLHFACYCGASTAVVGQLLYDQKRNRSTSSSFVSYLESPKQLLSSFSFDKTLLDRRGRTPLHCVCAGFRTSHRPAVILSLLKESPASATLPDEKGRTPFTLMYDDYAEEINEILSPNVSIEDARYSCLDRTGELYECWKILILLLKAAYLGIVQDNDGIQDDNHDDIIDMAMNAQCSSASIPEEKKNESLSPIRDRHNEWAVHNIKHVESGNLQTRATTQSQNRNPNIEVDLTNQPFQPVHAASACLYICPYGFFNLILKICGESRVKENDISFHLPLHLASKAISPFTSFIPSSSPKSISSTFHGESSSDFEDETSGVTISYRTDSEEPNKQRKYQTTSFQLPQQYVFQMTPIIPHLLSIYPEAASLQDESGKQPLLLSIESGKTWIGAIEPLLDAYPDLLIGQQTPLREEEGNHQIKSNSSAVDLLQASLLNALTNSSPSIRSEAASTIGPLMERWSYFASQFQTKQSSRQNADSFVRNLINASRYGYTSPRFDDTETNHESDRPPNSFSTNNDVEWVGIQAVMLQALSAALSSLSTHMINIPETPQKALDLACNMLRHEDKSIRQNAALVLRSSLILLGPELPLVIVQRVILLPQFLNKVADDGDEKLDGNSCSILGTSIHSLLSVASNVGHPYPKRQQQKDLLKQETPSMKHGRAVACFQLLCSPLSHIISVDEAKFREMTLLMKDLMLDEDATVRCAASLAIGPILGRSGNQASSLRIVRHSILKCMRATEENNVHINLARGLMIATKLKQHLFICKAGTPILEGALMLAVSGPDPTRRMFHGFLWLALGIGDASMENQNNCFGLSEYMSLAEGENGKLMMRLVSKTLSKIKSVRDVLDIEIFQS